MIVIWEEREPSTWRRGDVVSVLASGAPPGLKVLDNPRFLIIDTDMTEAEAQGYLEIHQVVDHPIDKGPHERRPIWINIDAIPEIREQRFRLGKDKPQPVTISKEELRKHRMRHGG